MLSMLDNTTQPHLTPKQVAERIHVHEQTLVKWRRAKMGPPWFRRGKRIFYRSTEVDDWYENGEPA